MSYRELDRHSYGLSFKINKGIRLENDLSMEKERMAFKVEKIVKVAPGLKSKLMISLRGKS